MEIMVRQALVSWAVGTTAVLVLISCSKPPPEQPAATASPVMGCGGCAIDDGGSCSRDGGSEPGLCAASCCAGWDSVIVGKVIDEVTGGELAGTTVAATGGGLPDGSLRAVTGPDGGFSFGPLPAGRYSLTVMYKDLVVQRWVIVDARTPVRLRVDTRRASGDAVWQQDGCDIPRCPGRKRPEIIQPRRGRRR